MEKKLKRFKERIKIANSLIKTENKNGSYDFSISKEKSKREFTLSKRLVIAAALKDENIEKVFETKKGLIVKKDNLEQYMYYNDFSADWEETELDIFE